MIIDWNKKVLELFTDFSDVNFQRRSWFGIGPEVSSPSEMCCWIDDIDLEGWLQSNPSLDTTLKKFIEEFLKEVEVLPEHSDGLKAFSSKEWMQIRLMASVIRDLLNKELDSRVGMGT